MRMYETFRSNGLAKRRNFRRQIVLIAISSKKYISNVINARLFVTHCEKSLNIAIVSTCLEKFVRKEQMFSKRFKVQNTDV
jgi:hypothetical protein